MLAAVLFLCFILGDAFPEYRDEIPNGHNVQHPCKTNLVWKGVGHRLKEGGGQRNLFGEDFSKHKIWNRKICLMDSDSDGRTNGEELGDPNCVWRKGYSPQKTENITHPGVCDPIGSEKCKAINTFIDCNLGDFHCHALNEIGTWNKTVRFPQTKVPARVTNYYCMFFDFPQDADYHLVASQPFIDNEYVSHHILVYGCSDKVANNPNLTLNEPQKCGMFSMECVNIVAMWTVGFNGECSHKHTGFRIGKQGYRRAMMQIHWNNPRKLPDYTDSSGITFFLQPRHRPYDSGVLMVGQNYLEIPPHQQRVVVTGECSSLCTGTMFTKPFNVTAGLNHMHYKGRQVKMELFRSQSFMQNITYDEVFSYDSPEPHLFTKPIVVNPHDEIKITCIYNSLNSNHTTEFGQATADEMCFGFLTYYPVESVKSSFCVAWKSLPTCNLYRAANVRNCNIWEMLDFKNPKTQALAFSMMQNCPPFHKCTEKCLEAYRPYEKHPCLVGDVGDWLRQRALRNKIMSNIFLGIDSCKVDRYKELHPCEIPLDPSKMLMHGNNTRECNLTEVFYQNSSEVMDIKTAVKRDCKGLYTCRYECLELLKSLHVLYPCLFGKAGDEVRAKAATDNDLYKIFLGLDSCKLEFYKSMSPCEQSTTQSHDKYTTRQIIVVEQSTQFIGAGTQLKLSLYSCLASMMFLIAFNQL